jgi:dolichyl-phosphate-mannose-protein mannosyltransferase
VNRTVFGACAASLALGLVFIFVRAPHPWGTEGFDHYHELALTLAAGRPFPTMEVPWGYAYFLAAFYRVFGDHPAIPLTAQVVANALLPWLVYRIAIRWFDQRTSVTAAILTGICSFNTVYASTQSSDAMCTVIFTVAVIAFLRANETRRLYWYAVAGALLGTAAQFRPNLLLMPLLFGAYGFAQLRGRRAVVPALILAAAASLALAPWTIRNYRLTRMIVPASVHSGVQLWYGTLQVGPYFSSRASNPRSVFEASVFDYTCLDAMPVVVNADQTDCAPGPPARAALLYWTNRDRTPRSIDGTFDGRTFTFEAPVAKAPYVLHYAVRATWSDGVTETTSERLFFITNDHFGDLDRDAELIDAFDLLRMMRHVAWNEPLAWEERLRAAGIGDRSLEALVDRLAQRFSHALPAGPRIAMFEHDEDRAVLRLVDGSTVEVPRTWHESITDASFTGALASSLMVSTEPMTRPEQRRRACDRFESVRVNKVFYRFEPHRLRRFVALALDNITRTPAQFAAATALRAFRLFVVWGSDDRDAVQQFEHGRLVNAVASAVSAGLAIAFAIGAVLAWRSTPASRILLWAILYVPITIAPMLTNMRYTVTVQPLMFVFVAVALTGRHVWRPIFRAEGTPAGRPTRESTSPREPRAPRGDERR